VIAVGQVLWSSSSHTRYGSGLPIHGLSLGTVDNHGNMEITETVIFVNCRDFAKMLCFCRVFAKMM